MTRHTFFLLFLSVLWAVCLPHSATAATTVSGPVTVNTTWNPAGSPYVISAPVTVNTGVTLTVEAGTVIKFAAGSLLTVNGTLNATGAPGNTVNFTDLRDDSVGGDTNGDGNATLPSAGGWQSINVSEGGSALLDYCVVRFGGGAASGSIYKYGGGTLTVSNSTVSDSKSYAINYVTGINTVGNISITNSTINANSSDGINISGTTGTINISGNTISGNSGSGIFIDSGSATLQNNILNNNGAYGMRLMGGALVSAAGNSTSGNAAGAVRMLANFLPAVSPALLAGNLIVDGGILSQNFTMTAGTPYAIVANFEVAAAATLTVPAGTVVKFGPGSGMIVSGALNTSGTAGNMVYFTDLRDDSVGGDTNGDLNVSTPAAGGWNGISIIGSATLTFSSIRYANTNVSKFGTGSLTISNSQISNASGAGISISASVSGHSITVSTITNNGSDGLRFTGNSGTIVVTGNSITGNIGSGIYSDSGALTLQNNIITGNSGYALNLAGGTLTPPISGNTFSGNTTGTFRLMAEHLQPLAAAATSGKVIIAGGTITQTTSLNSGIAYVAESIFTVGATTGILNIPAGTVVKFKPGSGIDVLGTLNAMGIAGNMVYFTDLRDDSAGGDTNGDGSSAGAPGGWRGILISSGSSILDYSSVRFGSDNIKSDGAGGITISNSVVSNASASGIQLVLSSATLTITNSTVSYNGTDGIQLSNSSGAASITGNSISYNTGNGVSSEGVGTNPIIRNNIIAKNAVGVYAATGALPVIGGLSTAGTGNSIFQNSTYGVQNLGSTSINATYNWWGASSGPLHATSNPAGTGNAVSNLVTFNPWLSSQTFSGAVATFTPEFYDFKRVRVGVPSVPQSFAIKNVGSQAVVFGNLSIGGLNPAAFQITADSCGGATIAVGASCTVTATFTPNAKQTFAARIDFPANAASVLPLYSVALAGTGFTPVTLPFTDDFIGSYSTDWSIMNEVPLAHRMLVSRQIGTDNETGLLEISTSATNLFGATTNASNLFTLALPTGINKLMVTAKMNFQYAPVLDNYQGGIIILPEQNSQPDLTNFIRTQFGRWNSVNTFQTTTNVSAVGTSTTWNQAAPAANWYWLRLVKNGTSYKSLYSTDGVTFTPWRTDTLQQEAAYAGLFAFNVTGSYSPNVDFGLFMVEALPTISAPASVAFGSVPQGSTTVQNVTISNSGSGPLSISSLNISGTNAGLFSVDPGTCGLPVPVGSSCSLSLSLNASVMGPISATLAIASNDIDTPTLSVPLTATAVSPISLSVGFLGTGSGTVTHLESNSVCGTNCSVISIAGATATFTAVPGEFTLFSAWGGSCSGSTPVCSFTAPGTTGGVTATFNLDYAHSVLIGTSSYFSSIYGAYVDPAAAGATIKMWGIHFPETVLFDLGKIVLLDGGYNGTFSSNSGGLTTVNGTMRVKSGTIRARFLAVKTP